ncbi:MAG TPA: hypothetical protein DHM44_08790 [Flexistipes sinusarabici]|uniref:CN hydrolase domain-containing protein n=1 Tax=Flexistipes sinusarabici TaxID=2352 RepID=A0A3D5QDM0_FLESI|nr:hypothetical protein [Flexistipes sinusarabici]
MKISCIQKDVYLGNISKNLDTFLPEIESASGDNCDIILLPEMWATGFDYNNLQSHSKNTPDILNKLSSIAGGNSVIISSLPENKEGEIYNTLYAVDSSGIKAVYRKNFLFSPLKEDQYFSKGCHMTVFEHNGVKLSLHTCYEIRFPELFRMAAFEGSQLMIVPAIWPAEKQNHWKTMLKARAIENQCFVAGCNAGNAHTSKKVINCGVSLICDPWGTILAEGSESREEVVQFNVDIAKCSEIREKIPSFNDAKNVFEIKRKSKIRTQ